MAGQARIPAGLPRPDRRHRRRAVRDVRRLRAGAGASGDHPEGVELADLFCSQARVRVEALFDGLWRNTDATDVAAGEEGARRAVHLSWSRASWHRQPRASGCRSGSPVRRPSPTSAAACPHLAVESQLPRIWVIGPARSLITRNCRTSPLAAGRGQRSGRLIMPSGRALRPRDLSSSVASASIGGRHRRATRSPGRGGPASRRSGWLVSARRASRSRPGSEPQRCRRGVARRIHRIRSGSHTSERRRDRHDQDQHDERDRQVVHALLLVPARVGQRLGRAGRAVERRGQLVADGRDTADACRRPRTGRRPC